MSSRRSLPILFSLLSLSLAAQRATVQLPVSAAQLIGTTRATTQTSQGGVERVTGFKDKKQWIAYTVNTPGGMYRAAIRYRTANGKGFELQVNGLSYAGFFPPAKEFATHDAGLIELPAGQAEIRLGAGWGQYEIAGLTLVPAEAPRPPRHPSMIPVNPNASPEAKALFKKLVASYGRVTLSGIYDLPDVPYVKEKTGENISILGRDLIEYTPSRVEHGSKGDGMTEKVIAQAKQGRIITLCWHWNAPTDLIDKVTTRPDGTEDNESWYFGFYTRATTFDFAKALDDENGKNYQLMLRDIDTIAVELRKLQAAHVPVLWRPLHEAEGGWFWWGNKGPQAYVKLYRLMYDRLTRVNKLNNLIWVYTSGGAPDWYPGDDVVDVIGADAYPEDNRDPLTGIWNTLLKQFGDRKLLALTEVGGVPDIERMFRHGVYWSFYNSWNGNYGPRGMKDDELRRRLLSPHVKNNGLPQS